MKSSEVVDLAKQLESDFAEQRNEDERIAGLLQRRHPTQSGQPVKPDDPVRRIGAGHGGLAVQQAFSLLTKPPFLRVNSPDKKQDAHAEKLENGLVGLWMQSQGNVAVWLDMVYDFVWSGRGVVKVCYYPQFWKDRPIGKGESEKEYLKRRERMKEDTLPILNRYVDSRCVWPVRDVNGDIKQVVEHLALPVRSARQAYGDMDFGKMKDTENVDIYIYADREVIKTVIGTKEAQEASSFEHGLGMNPYVFAEAPKSAPTSDSLQWRGVLYHTKDVIDAEDALISDAHYNIKTSIAAAYKLLKGEESSSVEPMSGGRNIKITPRGLIDNLEPGEDIQPLDPARTNVDLFQLLAFYTNIINSVAIQPVLFGAIQSGQSGTLYNTAAQFAQNQYGPATEQLERAARAIGKRLFRSIEAFGEKVPIYYTSADGNVYSCELGPRDVEGWENRIQARIQLAIPMNENAQMEIFRLATDPANPLSSWETAASRWGSIENPVEEWERIADNMVDRAMMDEIIKLVKANFVGEAAAADDPALQQRIAGLPPDLQQAMQIFMGNSGTGGQNARSMANTVRTAVPQNPSDTGMGELTQSTNGY